MTGGPLCFGSFRLDLAQRALFRDETPVRLGSRALEILCVLASAKGALVGKDELMARVWPGLTVEENNLQVHISALRKALDEGDGISCIVTVPGRGYRFVAPLRESEDATKPKSGRHPGPPLSIIVLPFLNLGGAPEYFADGITEDLTTDLSRIENMFVISRNTACTYAGAPVDAKQVGREAGVRYVLEGSVRRLSERIRVNAQLIDAENAAHLWAERFDGDAGDPFALQDEITRRIAVALNVELIDAEAVRTIGNPDALDCILQGRAAINRPPSLALYDVAIGHFERALALDPSCVEAKARLADALVGRVLDFCDLSAEADLVREADLARAETLAAEALAASPRSALSHVTKGQVLRIRGRYSEAISEYETGLAINRNDVKAFANLGRCKIYTGQFDEAIAAQKQALRLSHRDPQISLWYYRIGQAHLLQSRFEEAVVWLEKACAADPEPGFLHTYLAAAYALYGDDARAAVELAEARRRGFSSLSRMQSVIDFGVPEVRALFEVTYFAGLRLAGMPE